MRKVLIANRGEIAVRIARACSDVGLSSVAVYAEPDLDAPHVAVADEAYALGGDTPATSYLNAAGLLGAAARANADAVNPGYGFLSENADFAQAVLDAGLVWVGPPPQAIRALGDKVTARRLARRVGAPLVAGTTGPISGPQEAVALPPDLQVSSGRPAVPRAARPESRRAAVAVSGAAVTAPMQGTLVKVAVQNGQTVAEGDPLVVLEAMKMEQMISAHRSGVIAGLTVEKGQVVTGGTVICEIRTPS